MKPLRNNFLVSVDIDAPYILNIKGLDGNPLELRRDFNELYHTNQCGTIIATPCEFDEKVNDEKDLKEGGKVYFQYDVAMKKNITKKEKNPIFTIQYNLCYATEVSGEIKAIGNKIIIKKIKQKYEGELIVNTKNYPQLAQCVSSSIYAKGLGINVGDFLFIHNKSGAPIGNTELFWIPISLVKAFKNKDGIFPMHNRAVILETKSSDSTSNGVYLHRELKEHFRTGIVLESNIGNKGSEVTFIHTMNSRMNFEGKNYCIAEEKNLIFKNN